MAVLSRPEKQFLPTEAEDNNDKAEGDCVVDNEGPDAGEGQEEIVELQEEELETEAAPRRMAPERGEPTRKEI